MKRDWLHADQGYVHFQQPKTEEEERALEPAAGRLAASKPGRKNSPYLLPADTGDGHYTAAKGCLARLCASAKIEGVPPHTLRHTFGSVAGDLGFAELTIAALLGHPAGGTTPG